MQVHETKLPGVLVFEPRVFEDARGFFIETWQQDRYRQFGLPEEFVQDNLSRSCRSALRGLHYQIQHPQGKLVQVARGEVFDVAVDLRKDSPQFGQWHGEILSDNNHRQLYIPPGCAHGFYVRSEFADLCYKCTESYSPAHERTLLWNDPQIAIDWPLVADPILSDKDRIGIPFAQAECYDQSPS